MRYYYTDGRIASLMEEWHGIWGRYESGTGKWYIDESCHEMLKPQVLELVTCVEFSQEIQADGSPHKLIENCFYGLWLPTHTTLDGLICANHYKEIIQRNGKAFFTPETEE